MSAMSVDRLEPRRLLADVLPAAVNGAIVHQTIDAIGAAVTNYQQSVHRDPKYLNQVFGDLGISAVRGALDTGWEPKNDNADPNVFNWAGYDDTAIAPVMEFFAQAKARGVKTFLLTVWSPAAWLKTNKSVDHGGQLRPELREEYAEYIAAAVIRAKTKWGVDITHVSIMNEPWFTEPYPSAVFTPEQWRDTIKSVSAKFKREKLATQFIGPEDVSSLYRTKKYVEAITSDPVASAAVPIIGTHYLNDQDAQNLADTLVPLNKKLWYSEVGNGSADFSGALGLARGIDSAFTRADATAWINWQLSNSDARESLMKGGTPNTKYYALKHFAHFIRPGAQRIDVHYTGDLVRVSAYRDPKTGALTIELSNARTTPVDVQLSLSNLTLPASFKQYRTSATENFVQLANVAGGAKPVVNLPAGSIVTLYAGTEPAAQNVTTAAKFAPQKAIPDVYDTDPLRLAALMGAVDDVKDLIAAGHDVNAAFSNGWTPLFAASSSPYYWVDWNMQLLLDAGANPQLRDTEGMTALHVAAMSEIGAYGTAPSIGAKRVQILLDAGIDVNARDNNGRTALMYAAELPKVGGDLTTVDTSVIEKLLDAGADPTLKDNFGRTAADFAKAENATAALALLPNNPTPPPPPPPPPGGASIRAYVVNDTNKNGVWNGGELGVTGRTVWLDFDNDNVKDSNEPAAVTGKNGVFTFSNLKAGTYFVREVLPAGWRQLSPAASAPLTIKLTDNQASSGKYFATATA